MKDDSNTVPRGFFCDFPLVANGPASPEDNRSRILAYRGGGEWDGVPTLSYKNDAGHFQNVVRRVLVGDRGESPDFHLRYFEIGPGGFSSFERHHHEHVVIALHGPGEIRIGEQSHCLSPLDVAYVAPDEPHQLRNTGEAPFGFLCIVNAHRDRPVLLGMEEGQASEP